jgi:5-methylcytosine-specific restriction endonuclease McrA
MQTPGDYLYNMVVLKSSDAKRMWRNAIFERDGHRCVYCGCDRNLTIDHVRPRSRGGATNAENCATACRSCNQAKGSMHVEAFLQLAY